MDTERPEVVRHRRADIKPGPTGSSLREVRQAIEGQLSWCSTVRLRTGTIAWTSNSSVQVDIVDAATDRLICCVEVKHSQSAKSATDQ
jgi:hypothetical protein